MQDRSTIIGIIEMRSKGFSYLDVQARYRIGSGTITRIMKNFDALAATLDELKLMEAGAVVDAFFPPERRRRKDAALPDFAKIHERMLDMGKRADLSLIWMDYSEDNPNGYRLSQFYKLYGEYLAQISGNKKSSMPVERIPGQKMFIDWAGDTPELLLDEATGELSKVHFFVTTMGFSSYLYAEAFLDEKTPSFVAGTAHALTFYGGVPEQLVPDNCKVAVSKHTKDELILSSAYSDLEDYYDVVVLPPPARKPKGKPTVENHVRQIETHLIERLKSKPYVTLNEINRDIFKIIDNINDKPFQKKSDIRHSRKLGFEKYDQPKLRPLPGLPFLTCDYRSVLRIPDNYHVEYDDHYYSIPSTMVGKPAVLKATMSEIRICDSDNRLICKHERSYKTFPLYITIDEHMPAHHAFNKKLGARDGGYYRRWASTWGQSMETLIDRILRVPKHEEQAYRSCAGILHMCTDVPRPIVIEAADKCVEAKVFKYSHFKKVLGQAKQSCSHNEGQGTAGLPDHTNIRGKDYWK